MKWVLILSLILSETAFTQKQIAFLSTTEQPEDITVFMKSPYREIPFQLLNGMIMVEAIINHQNGYFILDTGAPMLVVNESRFRGSPRSSTAAGCSGVFQVGEHTIRHFSWAGIEQYELKALTTDLSHLEVATGKKILGLIGFNLLRNQELFIDYEQRRIILFSPDKNPLHRILNPIYTSTLSMYHHLPVIEFRIDGRPFRFGLDTGSESNLIDRCKLALLNKSLIDTIKEEEIQGLDKKIRRVPVIQVSNSTWEGMAVDQLEYLVTDLCHLKDRRHPDSLDGLLGFNFFKPLKISINYRERKFYLWERDSQL